jgi:hypothetical protein
MSYLEMARKHLESSSLMKPAYGPNALQECEKSEKSPRVMEQRCEKSEKSPAAKGSEDEQFICRAIERDLGLSPGNLTLWEPVR